MVTGGCQCGQVRYRITAPLANAYTCHCTECQKQSASAFSMAIPIALADLELTGETAAIERPTDSGAVTTCTFCPACGSRLYHQNTRSPGRASLKVGCLDDTSQIRPVCHLWVSKKQPWVVLDPELPAYDTQPTDLAAWRAMLSGA
jgi:hypothetical protein